jgi:hypothetical protein
MMESFAPACHIPAMTDGRKTPRQLEVLVLRAEKPHQGFKWELREYGKGLPMQAGEEIYSSQADARQAGNIALAQFKISTPP